MLSLPRVRFSFFGSWGSGECGRRCERVGVLSPFFAANPRARPHRSSEQIGLTLPAKIDPSVDASSSCGFLSGFDRSSEQSGLALRQIDPSVDVSDGRPPADSSPLYFLLSPRHLRLVHLPVFEGGTARAAPRLASRRWPVPARALSQNQIEN